MKTLRFLFLGMAAAFTAFVVACSDDEVTPEEPDNPTPEPSEEYDDAYYANLATISSDDTAFTATDEGGAVTFLTTGGEVVVDVDCGTDWTATGDADWLTVTAATGTVTLTAGQNEGDERTATVTFKTASEGIQFAAITATQNAYGAVEISVSVTECGFPAVGTLTAEIEVTASADYEASTEADWLTVDVTSTGITLTASENEGEERSAEVVVSCTDGISEASATITVTQDAKAEVSATPSELSFDGDGGSEIVTVTANFDWTCTTESDWLTLSASGEILTVTASENSTSEERTGTVVVSTGDGEQNVATTEITVTQEGKDLSALIFTYTVEAGTTIYLPIINAVDCDVDWGDGSDIESVNKSISSLSSMVSHTYEAAGEYDVSISGSVKTIRSYGYLASTTETNLTAVKQWGTTGLTTMSYAFRACAALTSVPADTEGSFASVTTFKDAFRNCSSLKSVSEGLFTYATKVTSLENTFYNCSSLSSLPGGLLNGLTANTSLDCTFYGCALLETVPAELLASQTEVTTCYMLFYSCDAFTTIPEDLFKNCTKVTDFSRTFGFCPNLVGESAYDMVNGEKVHLYERDMHTDLYATPTSTMMCYSQSKDLDDYAEIPSGWGGGRGY